MAFTSRSDLFVPASPEVAYDALADHGNWRSWMPATFNPVGHSPGTLEVGSRFLVRIMHGPPSPIRVTIADRGRQLSWTGGVRSLLHAVHHFYFEAEGEGTRVRSIERWSGVLSPLARPAIGPLATRIGRQHLEGLARTISARSRKA